MFEGIQKNKEREKLEVSTKRQQEKQLKLVGRIKPYRGHTLYKIDKKTLEIFEAKIEENDTISFKEAASGKKLHRKVIVEDGFFYISALNINSVNKKIHRMLVDAEAKIKSEELKK